MRVKIFLNFDYEWDEDDESSGEWGDNEEEDLLEEPMYIFEHMSINVVSNRLSVSAEQDKISIILTEGKAVMVVILCCSVKSDGCMVWENTLWYFHVHARENVLQD
jgi:hypothetical protein